MDDYIVLGRIGEGAHGIVMKGRHKSSGQVVALKKVLLKRLEDGIPETALREIKALQVTIFIFLEKLLYNGARLLFFEIRRILSTHPQVRGVVKVEI
jgi:serine/threonine protein kinase